MTECELYHHGIKGMKWGIRRRLNRTSRNIRKTGQAISAADIENRISRAKQTMKKFDSASDKRARYKAKIKQLNALHKTKVSDLSEKDIERGRAAYKAIKNVSVSVAVTAASTAVGAVYMPAGIATKIAGAGLASAINAQD